ncbi:hypothetical protein EVAR_16279_1 [Eumeta japonica]|uniref:Uncharacterized protein n=1 Tax=Eumeta variegata TaxID=151549 RepID=A0A4C1U624_EUMVA|nr:hypothetical protein EVAR_16279_1 [Eumeta japonica]
MFALSRPKWALAYGLSLVRISRPVSIHAVGGESGFRKVSAPSGVHEIAAILISFDKHNEWQSKEVKIRQHVTILHSSFYKLPTAGRRLDVMYEMLSIVSCTFHVNKSRVVCLAILFYFRISSTRAMAFG